VPRRYELDGLTQCFAGELSKATCRPSKCMAQEQRARTDLQATLEREHEDVCTLSVLGAVCTTCTTVFVMFCVAYYFLVVKPSRVLSSALHVRGMGAEGGKYKELRQLRYIFSPYGKFIYGHVIERYAADGTDTSYAHVYRLSPISCLQCAW
jgi:hypothetical protein